MKQNNYNNKDNNNKDNNNENNNNNNTNPRTFFPQLWRTIPKVPTTVKKTIVVGFVVPQV